MLDKTVPDGLELVTDPRTIRLFPQSDRLSERQQSFAFMPQKTHVKPARDKHIEAMGALTRMKCKERRQVFAADGTVNPQPNCRFNDSQLARFISRYVHFYKQKPSDNRNFILDQLHSVAKENSVNLPSPSEMNIRSPKKRLVVDEVAMNNPSTVVKLRVYYDGENLVGYMPNENKVGIYERRAKTNWDELFDALYSTLKAMPENAETNKTSAEKQQIRNSIEAELVRQFYEVYDYNDNIEQEPCPLFISRKLWNMSASYKERKKRFFRKKDQLRWTAWITITFDDNKFDSEDAFQRALKTYFKNKSHPDRGNWRVMGKFERGELNGRLHFHGFFYIPQGTKSRVLVNKSKYSDKDHAWHNYKADSELLQKFGDNEYEDIEDATHSDINAMAKYTDKMTRYMDKGAKVFYSRHIPTEFEIEVMGREIMTSFRIVHKREIKRYVLWDDAFVRSDTQITRRVSIAAQHVYDIGLMDEGTAA